MDIRELLQDIPLLPEVISAQYIFKIPYVSEEIGRHGANLFGFVKRLSSNRKAKGCNEACAGRLQLRTSIVVRVSQNGTWHMGL